MQNNNFQTPKIFPWVDWEEWSYVHSCLFARPFMNSSKTIQKGVDIVAMWRLRGRIPLAIDCSAQLIEILLKDTTETNRSEIELRLLYSMGIIRSINGLVDPNQQGYFAESIYSIGTKLGR